MLELHGDLDLELGDARARVVARGSTLEVEVARARDLRQAGGRGVLRMLAPVLAAHGLTLRVVAGGRTVLVAGSGARPGVVSRLILRIPATQLRLRRR